MKVANIKCLKTHGFSFSLFVILSLSLSFFSWTHRNVLSRIENFTTIVDSKFNTTLVVAVVLKKIVHKITQRTADTSLSSFFPPFLGEGSVNVNEILRHGPFDILGGAWFFFEKNFLALILAKKIILLNGTVKKIICLQKLPRTHLPAYLRCQNLKNFLARFARQ